jgi:flagellum-specific peptidoglycan hydrolase FlgJ
MKHEELQSRFFLMVFVILICLGIPALFSMTDTEPNLTPSHSSNTMQNNSDPFLENISVTEVEKVEEVITFKLDFSDETANEFIAKYNSVAIAENEKYKIPASITLAQGLLESCAGTSKLAVGCKNLFGKKCFSKTCGKGHCRNFTDDTHKDFFRVYTGVWDSFRDHSILLQGSRYKSCYASKNVKEWTVSIKKCGYATDPKYPQKLQYLIKKFNLTQYD